MVGIGSAVNVTAPHKHFPVLDIVPPEKLMALSGARLSRES
jgi:hypothetical protein